MECERCCAVEDTLSQLLALVYARALIIVTNMFYVSILVGIIMHQTAAKLVFVVYICMFAGHVSGAHAVHCILTCNAHSRDIFLAPYCLMLLPK